MYWRKYSASGIKPITGITDVPVEWAGARLTSIVAGMEWLKLSIAVQTHHRYPLVQRLHTCLEDISFLKASLWSLITDADVRCRTDFRIDFRTANLIYLKPPTFPTPTTSIHSYTLYPPQMIDFNVAICVLLARFALA
jgi:hypothetical protein